MRPIPLHRLSVPSVAVPGNDPWHARPEDPAATVMTDFRDRASVTVEATTPIDAALDHMKHAGVRSALVVESPSGRVIGLVTAYDITGEKALSLAGIHRSEVLVRDLMLPVREWHVARLEDVERATVADVAALFGKPGVTHVPVVEPGPDGNPRVRGLLSGAKVKRVLANATAAARTA